MKKAAVNFLIIVINCCLASCSTTTPPAPKTVQVDNAVTVVQAKPVIATTENMDLGKSMDVFDQEKLFHALDKGVGKSTHWTNGNTGISYTVEPIHKVAVNGNPYCRKYQLITVKNENRHESFGTACVSVSDGSWQIVN